MERLPVIAVMVNASDRSTFDETYLAHLAALGDDLGTEVVRLVGHLSKLPSSGRPVPFDAVTLVTLRPYVNPGPWWAEHGAALSPPGGDVIAHIGDEVEHWPYLRHWDLGQPTPGIKQLVFSRRLAHLDPAEYQRRYLEHAVVTNYHHSGVWRYAQCYFSETPTPDATEFHALAQLNFRAVHEQRERMYLDDDSIPVVADDVDRFLDRDTTAGVLAYEHRFRD